MILSSKLNSYPNFFENLDIFFVFVIWITRNVCIRSIRDMLGMWVNKSVPYTFTFTCNKKTKIKFYKTITYEAYPFKVFLIHQYDKLMFWYQCLCVCLQFYICVTALKHLKITFEFPLQSSFSKLSDASPTSQLILQPFHRFTYITAHSPTLPLLHLCHSSFSNSSFASPTSQALHLMSPREPPIVYSRHGHWEQVTLRVTSKR